MPGGIVFDLDGTLIDSAPDLQVALNAVLAGEGAAPVTLAQTRGFVGHGIPHLVQQARAARGIDPGRQSAMTAAMFDHYLTAPAALTRSYPGAVAFLHLLQDRGHPLALCTNKAMGPTLAILQALDLRRFFQVIVAGDSLPEKKPDPAPLLAAAEPLGPVLCLVGDSEVDAACAARAGIPFALHLNGYRKSPSADLPHALAFGDYAAPDLYGDLASIA